MDYKLNNVVRQVLTDSKSARNNYLTLYKKVFKKMGWSTDLNEMDFDTNIFESISRSARHCVESDPSLAATKRVLRNRKKREEEIKKWNRNSL